MVCNRSIEEDSEPSDDRIGASWLERASEVVRWVKSKGYELVISCRSCFVTSSCLSVDSPSSHNAIVQTCNFQAQISFLFSSFILSRRALSPSFSQCRIGVVCRAAENRIRVVMDIEAI